MSLIDTNKFNLNKPSDLLLLLAEALAKDISDPFRVEVVQVLSRKLGSSLSDDRNLSPSLEKLASELEDEVPAEKALKGRVELAFKLKNQPKPGSRVVSNKPGLSL